jgi:hypothetical protein
MRPVYIEESTDREREQERMRVVLHRSSLKKAQCTFDDICNI